jgi:hypothetical protein
VRETEADRALGPTITRGSVLEITRKQARGETLQGGSHVHEHDCTLCSRATCSRADQRLKLVDAAVAPRAGARNQGGA